MKTIDMKATGLVIYGKMEEKNVSVKEMAELMMISKMSIYHWINGRNVPSIENFVVLSDVLSCKIEDLIAVTEV